MWRSLICTVSAGLALAGFSPRSQAFSLGGAYAAWQTTEIGYQLPYDLGGAMNLGEEYRWNLPLITYGFDESFLNYFGTNGVAEIEKALKVYNELPAFSTMSDDLSEFPLDTRRTNHRASALYLMDLRSFTLGALLEILGVGPAERFVWTLRNRVVVNIPWYTVIKRNFDPVTFEPSSYVNGTLYTYLILQTYATPEVYEAVEFEVDPSLPSVSSVSAVNVNGGTVLATGEYQNLGYGLFYTGLTRDDIGALRYLYRPSNVNTETLLTNVFRAPNGTKSGNYLITSTTSGSPWGQPGGGTNQVTTNAAPVNQALRAGMDKLNFMRVDFDSQLGIWRPVTNVYVDHYISNYVERVQVLARPLATPDILFTAADLGVSPTGPPYGLPYTYYRTFPWLNLDAINGSATLDGPGLMTPPIVMSYSKLGMYLINTPAGGEADGTQYWWWGSFDGTTNAPIVYPWGASVKALERMVMSGQVKETPNPWRNPLAP
jgi:hypothetical protein